MLTPVIYRPYELKTVLFNKELLHGINVDIYFSEKEARQFIKQVSRCFKNPVNVSIPAGIKEGDYTVMIISDLNESEGHLVMIARYGDYKFELKETFAPKVLSKELEKAWNLKSL